MQHLRLLGRILNENADKIAFGLALFLTFMVAMIFIVFIGIFGAWLSPGMWIIGLLLFALCSFVFHGYPDRRLFKKLVGCMLLCILFATPVYAVSETYHDQSVAENLQTPKEVNYFKSLLGRSYNYTELIVWENQQLNFSGVQRSDDPIKIFENHQGMCGEFATLYATLCISQGYRCRIVDLVFNDHGFNELLLANGTWIRVDASLNDTSSRAIGYPMFFEKEPGWKPPILSLAFENSTITEVTSTYRSDGFSLISTPSIIVTASSFIAIAFLIWKLLIAPKKPNKRGKKEENENPSEETSEKISQKEETERNKLIYEIVVNRHNQELQRTSDLDTKATNLIGFAGILATLVATVIGFLPKGNYSILFFGPLALLILSGVLGLFAFWVRAYSAIQPIDFIEQYKTKSFGKTLGNYSKTTADTILRNNEVHEDKAELIHYSSALLVLAITLFFAVAIFNWLV